MNALVTIRPTSTKRSSKISALVERAHWWRAYEEDQEWEEEEGLIVGRLVSSLGCNLGTQAGGTRVGSVGSRD